MQVKHSALVLAGFAARHVAAAGWTDAQPFSCPGNTNNHCSPSQQGGYNWGGLQTGSFSSYGSNQFSGFTCANSFGKRDPDTKRSFQSKCIAGNLDEGPSMSGGSFSIDQMQISSSAETDIECHYGMPDGSTCTETHSCSPGGSIFQNTQCGGATSVAFKPGPNAPPGCTIGIHSVGFHCSSASSPPSHSTSVTVQSVSPSSPPSYTTSTPISSPISPATSTPTGPTGPPPCYGTQCSSVASSTTTTTKSKPSTKSKPTTKSTPTPSSPSSPPCYGSACSSPTTSPTTSPSPSKSPVSSPTSGISGTPPCYGAWCSSASLATSSTSTSSPSTSSPSPSPATSSPNSPPCYGTNCGVPTTSIPQPPPSSPSSTSSPKPPPSPTSVPKPPPSPVSPTSVSKPPPPPVSPTSVPKPPPSPVSPTPPMPTCPDVLPRCLKTWMSITDCKGNDDTECFCENANLITKVMECLGAWSSSNQDTSAAASYLMGLCADHVPNNPAIITACPSGVSPGPPPPTGSVSAQGTPPCTTITYSSSVIVPATFSTGVSSGFTCPGSSITTTLVTTVTVPAVSLVTSTVTVQGSTSCSVGISPSTPSSAPAYTTSAPPPPPPPSSSAPSPGLQCSEFSDGQPQCFTAPPPSASAGSTPAAPTYGASSAAATSFSTGWAGSYPTPTSSPIVPATGAGIKLGSGFTSFALAVVAALAAL